MIDTDALNGYYSCETDGRSLRVFRSKGSLSDLLGAGQSWASFSLNPLWHYYGFHLDTGMSPTLHYILDSYGAVREHTHQYRWTHLVILPRIFYLHRDKTYFRLLSQAAIYLSSCSSAITERSDIVLIKYSSINILGLIYMCLVDSIYVYVTTSSARLALSWLSAWTPHKFKMYLLYYLGLTTVLDNPYLSVMHTR